MKREWILSTGIDIGTSTTKMIVSRLRLVRTSSALSLPRYEISERELLYASPIHTTPLLGNDEVDGERIGAILDEEYKKAGIQKADLKSGAVIITGETANKRNARHILHLLAKRAGDFVVATAGADLEGLLAGKGAGAEKRSYELKSAVANIDVGGGTANAAIFSRGKLLGTVTFQVGGRLIRINAQGTVLHVSPSIQPWLRVRGYRIEEGQRISFELLQHICISMCRCMLDHLAGNRMNDRESALKALVLGAPLPQAIPLEEWMVSGGIGRLMGQPKPESLEQTAVYEDIGPLLAHTLKECAFHYGIRLVQPDQDVRATVIGAGMQSTEISGATVYLADGVLPLRNLPVIKLELTSAEWTDRPAVLEDAVKQVLQSAARLYEHGASPPFALALSGMTHMTYAALQWVADTISRGYKTMFSESRVMVIICDNDIAKALGQALERRCGGSPKTICIDQIGVEHGDYIDLGEPIAGMMIPVVVKTLAFHHRVEVRDA